jgi:teichuronic acid biosynthesis glycosyltransferase TuaC
VKVCVVAEFYPRAHDPVIGIWAHRQALAARDAGADVRVVVLYRPVPPRATARRDLVREARRLVAQPRRATLDGLQVEYVPFLAPPRPRHYGNWGAWAAPSLAIALRRLRRRFPFDVVHAHNAVPAADAVLRAGIDAPLVVSEHGADVFHTVPLYLAGRAATERAFDRARIVLANSAGVERSCRALGAARTRVLLLGTDVPPARVAAVRPAGPPTLVTVAHLVARKRHGDVLRALWLLRDRHPDARYVIIGDGPERGPLERLAGDLGLTDRVEFTGQLRHEEALARAREGELFVMPSIDEAFGVAYIEAMAAGVPAIGAIGEAGPEEIAHAGDGIRLVAPADVESLAGELDALLGDEVERAQLGRRARATVERAFTWERCGRDTLRAYEDALAA